MSRDSCTYALRGISGENCGGIASSNCFLRSASFANELVSVIVRLVIAGAGTAFMAYGIPYLKKIGVYKLVQIAVRAAEKLGATGAIEKADKKKYVMEALERLGVKITPTIETMIEAAVKEMDIQNDKIKDEFKKN